MSLIFDKFPTEAKANEFADKVRETFKVEAIVFMDEDKAQQHDPFPFELTLPIVHVGRGVQERRIQDLVTTYGGEFAGT